jgi:hypothetical protein
VHTGQMLRRSLESALPTTAPFSVAVDSRAARIWRLSHDAVSASASSAAQQYDDAYHHGGVRKLAV